MAQNTNTWRQSRFVPGYPPSVINTVWLQNTQRYTREFQPYPTCFCRRLFNPVPPPRPRLPERLIAVAGDVFPTVADVHQYAPNELMVNIIGPNEIVVEGKHEDRRIANGFVTRCFKQRIIVPDTHDAKRAIARITAEGNMSLWIPRKPPTQEDTETETESETEVTDVVPYRPIALPNAENYQQWSEQRR